MLHTSLSVPWLWATSALPACMAKCVAATPKAPGKNWDGRGAVGRAGHSCTSNDPTGTELPNPGVLCCRIWSQMQSAPHHHHTLWRDVSHNHNEHFKQQLQLSPSLQKMPKPVFNKSILIALKVLLKSQQTNYSQLFPASTYLVITVRDMCSITCSPLPLSGNHIFYWLLFPG